MTISKPRVIGGILVAVVVVLVAGAVLRATWPRISPQLSSWFSRTSTNKSAPPTSQGTPSGSPTPTAGGGQAQAPTADARAEVTIDPRRQQLIGVRLAPVERGEMSPAIRTVGVVRYDETRLADVNLKLEGWIRDLYVDYTGQFVRRGQPLFTVYSPDLLATQQELLLALKTRDQIKGSEIADARSYADRLVDAARRRIALWDLSDDQVQRIEQTRTPQTVLTFTSPASGYVIEKHALKGLHVMPGQSLYRIADLSVVWVEADLYEQELPLMRVGQRATITLDTYPGERFTGRAIYIYPTVEEKTRTAKVRFELPNARGRLKPGMFANVELEGPRTAGLTIPANALLDSGMQQVVFVAQGDGVFEPRPVKAGRRMGDAVQILDGLKEGEQVATSAAFFLDSESQLRAALEGFEATPTGTQAAGAARERLTITFRSQPDPPRTGENNFEVTVKDASGQPIADGEVSVQFYMAAMPTMNMPAMRNETKLEAVGGGVYRGTGQVMMAGRWDVTVSVMRQGQRLGSKQFGVVAR